MIVGIAGSGRPNGHSTRLLRAALEGAEAAGLGPSQTFPLAQLNFRGCIGCGSCRRDAPVCVLQDDLTPVLEATAEARAVVLASPIYYGYATGLFKSYLDRWYSFRDRDRRLRVPESRPALLILTQGNRVRDAYAWTVGSLEKVLAAYGFQARVLVAPDLEEPEELSRRPHLLAEARTIGASLKEVPRTGG
jgi:multimeric flavodoxin WrbA